MDDQSQIDGSSQERSRDIRGLSSRRLRGKSVKVQAFFRGRGTEGSIAKNFTIAKSETASNYFDQACAIGLAFLHVEGRNRGARCENAKACGDPWWTIGGDNAHRFAEPDASAPNPFGDFEGAPG